MTSQLEKTVRRHILVGWWCLSLFLSLGVLLEMFHGFKVGWYLDGRNETRRLMWTLAHAHGTLLSLIQIAFAVTIRAIEPSRGRRLRAASICLLLAGVLIPLGFFLGGLMPLAGDPGLGVLVVPAAAPLLLVGVLLTASMSHSRRGEPPPES